MVRGDEFSDTILALEENLTWLRQDLRVLQLGLATGGPRPYQDPRSHQWCMLRLRRLLGGAEAGGDVARTLAELTKSLQTTAWHAVGDSFAEEVATGMEGRTWLRLKELLLSCGIMGGDLEGLAACFGRWGIFCCCRYRTQGRLSKLARFRAAECRLLALGTGAYGTAGGCAPRGQRVVLLAECTVWASNL